MFWQLMLDSKCLPIPIKSSVTQLLHFYVLLLQTDIKFVPSLRINSFVADSQSRIYCRQPDQVVSWILCMNMLHWNTPETALTAPPPLPHSHPKVKKMSPSQTQVICLTPPTACHRADNVCVLMMWTWCHMLTGSSPLWWCDIIVVIFPPYTATLPTVLTDIIELYR